jgi:hypothetical protein
MANPTSDSYTGSSGAVVRGGRGGGVIAPPPPPPPVITGPLNTRFTLTSPSTIADAPFSIGHVFTQGQAAGSTVNVAGATAQVTPKNYWPDGSLKFAVIAGTANLTANVATSVTLSVGTASAGAALTIADLKTAMSGQTCSIDCGAFGSVSWATTDFDTPFESWVSGHRMSSWVYRKQVGADAHLVAWIEISLFAGGAVRVLPWVENGYLLTAGPTNKSATYTFTLGGSVRFSAAIDIPRQCRTPLISGAALVYWLGTDPDVTPSHDGDYLQSTGMVPAYLAKTPSSAASITGLPATFAPLQAGSFPVAGLGGVGGNNYVGMLPEWDAVYLTNGSAATYKAVVRNGYSAGRYPIHWREDATFADPSARYRWPLLANHPTLHTTGFPAGSGTAPVSWTRDHQPCIGYLAYLITGMRYHLDTLQCSHVQDTWQGSGSANRLYGLGVYQSQYAMTVRGTSWAWRNLALCLAVAPDATYETAYREQLKNNVDHYWAKYVGVGGPDAPRGNNMGFIHPYSSYTANLNGTVAVGSTASTIQVTGTSIGYGNALNGQFVGSKLYSYSGSEDRVITSYTAATNTFTVSPAFTSVPTSGTQVAVRDGNWWHAPWMSDYLTSTMGWALDLGCGFDATTQTRQNQLFQWQAKAIVGRLGFTGDAEFFYRDFAPYVIPIAPFSWPNDAAWDNATGPWFSSWAEIYALTYSGTVVLDSVQPWPYASNGPKIDGNLRNDAFGNPEGSPAAALPAIAYAVKHGVPGAEAGYQRITNAGNWADFITALDSKPVMAVAPKAIPRYARGVAINQWVEIPGSNMNAQVPTNIARTVDGLSASGSAINRLKAWNSLSIDNRRGHVYSTRQGGHGDYYGNEVCRIDLMQDAPLWVEVLAGSSGNVINSTAQIPNGGDRRYAQYTDGKPCSVHSYNGQQFLERHNRALSMGGATSPRGAGFENVEAYQVDVGWDAYVCATESPPYGYAQGNANFGWMQNLGFSACKDPRTECIYTVNGSWTYRFTPNVPGVLGGIWETISNAPWGPNTAGYSVFVCDTKRNKLILMLGNMPAGKNAYTLDLATNVWSTGVALPAGADASELLATPALQTPFNANKPGSSGGVYVPATDTIYIRTGAAGGTVYTVNPATLAVGKLPTTGGSGVPQAATYVDQQGVYGRWMYVRSLRGCVIFPAGDVTAWFLRLH